MNAVAFDKQMVELLTEQGFARPINLVAGQQVWQRDDGCRVVLTSLSDGRTEAEVVGSNRKLALVYSVRELARLFRVR